MKLDPGTPLDTLSWIPRNRLPSLSRLGLRTIGCLLRNYPRRYEDRRAFPHFPDTGMEEPICLRGEITNTALKRFGRRKGIYEVTLGTIGGGALSQPILCRWFNMPYMQGVLMVDQQIIIFGRPKTKGHQIVIDHPEYEVVDEDEESSIHMHRIAPVHPAGEGVTTRMLRSLVFKALEVCDLAAVSLLGGRAGKNSIEKALRDIHFPDSFEAAATARKSLALEECFVLQVLVQQRKARWGEGGGIAKPARPGKSLVGQLLESLPFTLTQSQMRVIDEIRGELVSPGRMHRLLQGDVGSGKTLVALVAMLHAVEAGYPAAIMAPTQILAEQHHANFSRLLEPLGVPLAIHTGSKKSSDAPLLEKGARILVGTHALLYEETLDAGLVVIDEQHKFGVLQRGKLVALPSTPDVLVMTATPIPRTLAQTVFGDLDISTLDEKPPGRGSVRTVVRPANKLPEVADFLRKHLAEGRQAYIVYALIEESEKLSAKAAAAEFGKWENLLSPHTVGLLHGRTPMDEKDRIMNSFRTGQLGALVSTTVIEVGVDVPNASLLLVENAERFGLAQLHQLRGRIGRGTHKSYCVLLHNPEALPVAIERLAVLERSSDGFEVAEEDLRIRGMGNLLGTAQAGLPPLKIPELATDPSLMARAARLASDVLSDDPCLEKPEHRALRGVADQISRQGASVPG